MTPDSPTPYPGDETDPNQTRQPYSQRPLAGRPWVSEHPGAVLVIAGALWSAVQWASTKYIQDSQAPTIRAIHHDIKTLATHQLEAQRSNRSILKRMAAQQGIEYVEPPELIDAEVQSRKLRQR